MLSLRGAATSVGVEPRPMGSLVRCAECGHEHPAEEIVDVLDDGSELMCIWCVRSDYENDPLGNYTENAR